MRTTIAAIALLMMCASSASAEEPAQATPPQGAESARLAAQYDPTRATVITAADVAAAIGRLPSTGVSRNATFVERNDTASRLAYRVAVDRRRIPQSANAHPTEAEIWAVIDGTGAITTGGKIVEVRKDGKMVGAVVEGGTTQRVSKGDFVVIPEGVPHYVTEASPELIFVSIEFPRPRAIVPVAEAR